MRAARGRVSYQRKNELQKYETGERHTIFILNLARAVSSARIHPNYMAECTHRSNRVEWLTHDGIFVSVVYG